MGQGLMSNNRPQDTEPGTTTSNVSTIQKSQTSLIPIMNSMRPLRNHTIIDQSFINNRRLDKLSFEMKEVDKNNEQLDVFTQNTSKAKNLDKVLKRIQNIKEQNCNQLVTNRLKPISNGCLPMTPQNLNLSNMETKGNQRPQLMQTNHPFLMRQLDSNMKNIKVVTNNMINSNIIANNNNKTVRQLLEEKQTFIPYHRVNGIMNREKIMERQHQNRTNGYHMAYNKAFYMNNNNHHKIRHNIVNNNIITQKLNTNRDQLSSKKLLNKHLSHKSIVSDKQNESNGTTKTNGITCITIDDKDSVAEEITINHKRPADQTFYKPLDKRRKTVSLDEKKTQIIANRLAHDIIKYHSNEIEHDEINNQLVTTLSHPLYEIPDENQLEVKNMNVQNDHDHFNLTKNQLMTLDNSIITHNYKSGPKTVRQLLESKRKDHFEPKHRYINLSKRRQHYQQNIDKLNLNPNNIVTNIVINNTNINNGKTVIINGNRNNSNHKYKNNSTAVLASLPSQQSQSTHESIDNCNNNTKLSYDIPNQPTKIYPSYQIVKPYGYHNKNEVQLKTVCSSKDYMDSLPDLIEIPDFANKLIKKTDAVLIDEPYHMDKHMIDKNNNNTNGYNKQSPMKHKNHNSIVGSVAKHMTNTTNQNREYSVIQSTNGVKPLERIHRKINEIDGSCIECHKLEISYIFSNRGKPLSIDLDTGQESIVEHNYHSLNNQLIGKRLDVLPLITDCIQRVVIDLTDDIYSPIDWKCRNIVFPKQLIAFNDHTNDYHKKCQKKVKSNCVDTNHSEISLPDFALNLNLIKMRDIKRKPIAYLNAKYPLNEISRAVYAGVDTKKAVLDFPKSIDSNLHKTLQSQQNTRKKYCLNTATKRYVEKNKSFNNWSVVLEGIDLCSPLSQKVINIFPNFQFNHKKKFIKQTFNQ
ncbi:beclin-1-like protein A [Oppia nitens]|uniref:beclin-1-like protein A n=1 Tax=Oppia nitens TaxID=1686743 RepID=UPI0023DB09F2|nr:beclin-1-like protein A [Oppia nitens]